MKKLYPLFAITLFSLACGAGTDSQPNTLTPCEECQKSLQETNSYDWRFDHITITAAYPGDGNQCGGGYHFVSGSCWCNGKLPIPGAIDVNANFPTWRCGTCPGGEAATNHINCLKGPSTQLDPYDYLNGQLWPPM